jgi:hypothetical protein
MSDGDAEEILKNLLDGFSEDDLDVTLNPPLPTLDRHDELVQSVITRWNETAKRPCYASLVHRLNDQAETLRVVALYFDHESRSQIQKNHLATLLNVGPWSTREYYPSKLLQSFLECRRKLENAARGIASEEKETQSHHARAAMLTLARANSFLVIDHPDTKVVGQPVLLLLSDTAKKEIEKPPIAREATLSTLVTRVVVDNGAFPSPSSSTTTTETNNGGGAHRRALFWSKEHGCNCMPAMAVVVFNDLLLSRPSNDGSDDAGADKMFKERVHSRVYGFNDTVWNKPLAVHRSCSSSSSSSSSSKWAAPGLIEEAYIKLRAINRRYMHASGYIYTSEAIGMQHKGGMARVLGPDEPDCKDQELKILEPSYEKANMHEAPVHGKECLAEALSTYMSHPSGAWLDFKIERPDIKSFGIKSLDVATKQRQRIIEESKFMVEEFLHDAQAEIPRDPWVDSVSRVGLLGARRISTLPPAAANALSPSQVAQWPRQEQYPLGSCESIKLATSKLCTILMSYDAETFYYAICNATERYRAHLFLADITETLIFVLPKFRTAVRMLNLNESTLLEFANNAPEDAFGLLATFLNLSDVCLLCQTCKLFGKSKMLTDRRPVIYWVPAPYAELSNSVLGAWQKQDNYAGSLAFCANVRTEITFYFGQKHANAWLKDASDFEAMAPVSLRDTFRSDLQMHLTLVFDSLEREPVPDTAQGSALKVAKMVKNFDPLTGCLQFETNSYLVSRAPKEQEMCTSIIFTGLSSNHAQHLRLELDRARQNLGAIEDQLARRERARLIDELADRNQSFQHFRVRCDAFGMSQNNKPVSLVSFSPPFVVFSKKRRR